MERQRVVLMELLQKKGAKVEYTDPHVPIFPKMRGYDFDLTSINPTAEKIAEYDVLLLATDHTNFDYQLFKQHAKLIIDTRGVFLKPADNIVKA